MSPSLGFNPHAPLQLHRCRGRGRGRLNRGGCSEPRGMRRHGPLRDRVGGTWPVRCSDTSGGVNRGPLRRAWGGQAAPGASSGSCWRGEGLTGTGKGLCHVGGSAKLPPSPRRPAHLGPRTCAGHARAPCVCNLPRPALLRTHGPRRSPRVFLRVYVPRGCPWASGWGWSVGRAMRAVHTLPRGRLEVRQRLRTHGCPGSVFPPLYPTADMQAKGGREVSSAADRGDGPFPGSSPPAHTPSRLLALEPPPGRGRVRAPLNN